MRISTHASRLRLALLTPMLLPAAIHPAPPPAPPPALPSAVFVQPPAMPARGTTVSTVERSRSNASYGGVRKCASKKAATSYPLTVPSPIATPPHLIAPPKVAADALDAAARARWAWADGAAQELGRAVNNGIHV